MATNSSSSHLANFVEVYEYHKNHYYIITNQYLNYIVAILTNIVVTFTFYVIRNYGKKLATFYRSYYTFQYCQSSRKRYFRRSIVAQIVFGVAFANGIAIFSPYIWVSSTVSLHSFHYKVHNNTDAT